MALTERLFGLLRFYFVSVEPLKQQRAYVWTFNVTSATVENCLVAIIIEY